MKNSYVKDYFTKGWSLIEKCVSGDDKFIPSIVASAEIMCDTLHAGGKILSCGNGGSMSDAMHFASELSGRYKDTRDPIAAMALSDPGAMSCIANDFGYDHVFSRQVEAIGRRGDTLLAISTSGTSRNVLHAIFQAKERGIKVIALTGVNGTTDYCDVQIKVPSIETGYVQQIHIMVIHVLVELIEKNVDYYKSITL